MKKVLLAVAMTCCFGADGCARLRCSRQAPAPAARRRGDADHRRRPQGGRRAQTRRTGPRATPPAR